jgi:hypothetical protein
VISVEDLAKVEAAHPGMIRCTGPKDDAGVPEWEVLVRRPTRPEFKRYRARLRDPQWAPEATEEMITDMILRPDRPGFQKLLDTWPALCEGIAALPAVAAMLGLTARAQGK